MIRFHYTIYQKLQILDLIRTGQLARLAEQFAHITQKQVDEWLEKEDQMGSLSLEKQQTTYILHPGPQIKYPELFQFLYQLVKDQRQERRAITVNYLISQALKEEPSIRHLSPSGQKSLIARFMEYFKLSIREITGFSGARPEQLSEEQKTSIEEFKREYRRLIETHQIPPENVFNMDQTGIWYENPSSRTIDFRGSQEVSAQVNGDDKKRLTLFSLINAKGEIFPQLFVFKGTRDGRIHQELQEYNDYYFRFTAQENAWTDRENLLEWIFTIWKPLVSPVQGAKLLLIDAYPLHKEVLSKFMAHNIYVLLIPKGLTWALQPLDAGYFKVYKDELKKLWLHNQGKCYATEKDKRRAIIQDLVEVTDIMNGKDNSVYWRKQGLDYESNMIQIPQNQFVSGIAQENNQIRSSSPMMIENEASDDNLFTN